jgi:nucleoside-diphosphate-sugar epimerase
VKRVLVTGAAGFVGRFALPELVARGYQVFATDLRPPAHEEPGVAFRTADLLAPGEPAGLLAWARPTHLLHLAWYAAHGRFWNAPENLACVQASLALLRAFREADGQRVTVAGTCAEYHWSAGGTCREESTPLRPATLYGAAKDALRRVLQAYAASSGLAWAWGRLFMLYGPHEDPGRLVASVIGARLAGREVALSSGEQERDFLHVADVAGALVALLESPVEGAVNVGSGAATTIRQLVERICAIVPEGPAPRYGALPARPGDPPRLVADVGRLTGEVGFVPRYDLQRGLEETVTWWRKSRTTR